MEQRTRILSIGRDATVVDPQSQLHKRFVSYDQYHTHTLLVLRTILVQEQAKAIVP